MYSCVYIILKIVPGHLELRDVVHNPWPALMVTSDPSEDVDPFNEFFY